MGQVSLAAQRHIQCQRSHRWCASAGAQGIQHNRAGCETNCAPFNHCEIDECIKACDETFCGCVCEDIKDAEKPECQECAECKKWFEPKVVIPEGPPMPAWAVNWQKMGESTFMCDACYGQPMVDGLTSMNMEIATALEAAMNVDEEESKRSEPSGRLVVAIRNLTEALKDQPVENGNPTTMVTSTAAQCRRPR